MSSRSDPPTHTSQPEKRGVWSGARRPMVMSLPRKPRPTVCSASGPRSCSDPAAFPMFNGGYPLTAAGKAGLAKWNPRNNILLKCGTKGTPLIMISPLPMEFSRQGDKNIMRLEEYDSVRTIHMNPKDVAPPAKTLFGFSRGRWEGTTLVVETDHIAAGYFDHEGTPQSDQIKTVERYIPNADYTRLDY